MTTILFPAPADVRLTFGPVARPSDNWSGLEVSARVDVAVSDEYVRASASSVVSFPLDHMAAFARSLRRLSLAPNAEAELESDASDARVAVSHSGQHVQVRGWLGSEFGNRLRFEQDCAIERIGALAGDFEAVVEALRASPASSPAA